MDPGEALLFPVFPFEVWTLETEDAEKTRIALKISELNPSRKQIFEGEPFGSAARTPIMESRAGRGGELPLLLASYYRNCFSPLPNGFSNFEGVTAHSIEHLGCITTALQEGLMQSISPRPAEPEMIRVAPAWPDEWDAAFRLLARGGFLVASVIEAGRPRFIEIEARLGGECRVRNPWGGKCAVMRRNELIVESDGDVIRFAAEKGARYLLLPEGAAPPGPIAVSAQRSGTAFLVLVRASERQSLRSRFRPDDILIRPTPTASLHFSPRGEAKWVRGPSGRGARRLARAGVLEQYVEHGKQAQRSPGGRIVCFDRRVVRKAG